MKNNNLGIYKRALGREKQARKVAEKILEEKSAELFKANQKLEKLVKEKASELRGVFENIVDAYVVMDLTGTVIKMNEAAVHLLGFDNAKEYYNLNQLVIPSEQKRVSKAFKILVKEGAITNFEVNICVKKREQKLVHINASLIFDTNNIPIAAQGIVRDVTEIHNLHKQKERLLEQLEKSNKELQEYAHVVSHDLKSPLRSIYALVNWLKEDNMDKLDADSLQHIYHIESTLEKMEQLIKDVLTYSSINTIRNKKDDVDISSVLNHVIEMMFVPDNIKICIHSKMPVLKGDKTKLQQLFQNLIGNAIKYNDKENGIIQIKATELDNYFQFSIIDNGIGIEKKYHKTIFKVFHSIEKKKNSSGIGLSIVKKIVQLHDGKIWIESIPAQGTTFHFTLKK